MDVAVHERSRFEAEAREEASRPRRGGWIVFEGREYADADDMPVDVRIMYDRMAARPEAGPSAAVARRGGDPLATVRADLRVLQADVVAALSQPRSSGNGVVLAAGALTGLVFAVWLLV